MNSVNESNIDHDQNFKELLHQLFEPFLHLFFPEHAARLDFSKMTFLEQEYFTDFPKGRHRFIDTLVEVNTLSGNPQLILVHVEFQAKRSKAFPRRMFRYFSQLRLRRDTPIFPVVLYLPIDETEEEEFQQLIRKEEVEVMRFITSWERKGIAEGELKALRETLLRQLRIKFSDVPPAIEQRVLAIEETEKLGKLLGQLIQARSIEQMGLASDA